MARIHQKKVEISDRKLYAVMLYNIVLVLATVVAMYVITPWAFFMLLALASVDDEEIIVEDADGRDIREALDND